MPQWGSAFLPVLTPLLSNGLARGDILTFDPHAQNEAFNNTANSYVYEALLNLNKGKVQPCLAESWTSVPEGFVFKLRKGVKFHEEEPLTAEDVAFSINRALHPISQFKTFTAGILGRRGTA